MANPRDGEYFGQFWGSGVPGFGGGVKQGLQAAMPARGEEPRPGEWCATWGWTRGQTASDMRRSGVEKQLRPVPRAAAPLLHIDEAIRRLKAKPSYNADSLKVKALSARRSMLKKKPHVPEHEPRGFGSSIKTDRGVDPRLAARNKLGGTKAAKRTPMRKDTESVNRAEFSAWVNHFHRNHRKDGQILYVSIKKLQKLMSPSVRRSQAVRSPPPSEEQRRGARARERFRHEPADLQRSAEPALPVSTHAICLLLAISRACF